MPNNNYCLYGYAHKIINYFYNLDNLNKRPFYPFFTILAQALLKKCLHFFYLYGIKKLNYL